LPRKALNMHGIIKHPQHVQARDAKSAVTRLPVALGPEESDSYPRVVVRLNGKWRVVACRGGIQWILQSRKGPRGHSRCYCRTRDGLVQCAHERAGEIGGDALIVLLRLPARIDAS